MRLLHKCLLLFAVSSKNRYHHQLGGGWRRTTGNSPERVRSDALPEFTDYFDSGCSLHDSCLHCPEERCLYDERGTLRRWCIRRRAVIAVLLIKAGVPMEQTQTILRASRRSIYRWLHDLRMPA
jgi:hypothetical protein